MFGTKFNKNWININSPAYIRTTCNMVLLNDPAFLISAENVVR